MTVQFNKFSIPKENKTIPNENYFNIKTKKPLIFTDKWPNTLISNYKNEIFKLKIYNKIMKK